MLTIGTLGKRTGTKVQTIRYYEQIGLLPEPERTAGGQRRYGKASENRLAFIRHSRQLGFSLESIRELLSLADSPEQPCAPIDSIAQRQLAQVQNRIDRLHALKTELERMILHCGGGKASECKVLDVLGDHTECLTEHQTIGA